jgi:hypothetical protein
VARRPPAEPRREPLPVFRLPAAEGHGAGTGPYRIDAEVNETGAILRLEGGSPRLPGPATSGAWILDASSLGSERIVGLDLGLAPSAGDFIGYVRVEKSDDLTTFRVVKDRAAVARLARGGHEIDRSTVRIPATRARYLRLTLVDGVLPADVELATARLATTRRSPEVVHTRLSGTPIDDAPGAYLYDLGADLPIERIDVVPAEPNTLIEVGIAGADSADGPWIERHTALVYRLDDGETLRSEPIRWRRGRDRFLRLVVSTKGDGHRRAAPALDVAWLPAQVLFITRGAPPFTLAVGKRGAPDVAFRADALVRLAGEDAGRLAEATATLGPPVLLAGDAAFEEPSRPVSWRRVGLWGVLVGAVGVVLALSVRLLRRGDPEAGARAR